MIARRMALGRAAEGLDHNSSGIIALLDLQSPPDQTNDEGKEQQTSREYL